METKVHYHVHKNPPLDPVHTLMPYFPNIPFNIILPATLNSPKLSLPLSLTDQNVYVHFYIPFEYYKTAIAQSV
jgi:hypothetical protein